MTLMHMAYQHSKLEYITVQSDDRTTVNNLATLLTCCTDNASNTVVQCSEQPE